MTTAWRRVIQAGVLGVVGLACLAEVLQAQLLPDRLVWRLSLFRPWSVVVVDILPVKAR